MVSRQASRDLLRPLWNFAKDCWQLWQGRGGREAEPAQGGPCGHDLHVNRGNKHEICPLLLHRNYSHWLLHSVSRVSAPPPLCWWHGAIVHCPRCNCYIQPADTLKIWFNVQSGKIYGGARHRDIVWYTDATCTENPHLDRIFWRFCYNNSPSLYFHRKYRNMTWVWTIIFNRYSNNQLLTG